MILHRLPVPHDPAPGSWCACGSSRDVAQIMLAYGFAPTVPTRA